MADQTDIVKIEHIIAPLLGHKTWGATLGLESFITLEFGTPRAKKKRIHGEWHLWIYHCAWRLEKGNSVIAGSSDPRDHLVSSVKIMNDLTLISIALGLPSLETTLLFEQNVSLHLFPTSITETELAHWKLFNPDGYVLRIGPGTNWSYVDASIPSP